MVCYAFTAFGKAAIKQKKLHPDTFVQLAKQLAYHKMHKRYGLVLNRAMLMVEVCEVKLSLLALHRPGSCYETATTRTFYHGRTETMRPCTQESVNWCKAMMDPTCDVSAVLSGPRFSRGIGLLLKCCRGLDFLSAGSGRPILHANYMNIFK